MISLSAPVQSDHRFIISTWLDSYKKNHCAGPVPYNRWKEIMTPVAVELFLGDQSRTVVARFKGETNTKVDLAGWASVKLRDRRPPLVQYVYVKGLYRGHGLSRQLLKVAGVDRGDEFVYSCSTKHSRQMVEKGLLPEASLDPQAIRKA